VISVPGAYAAYEARKALAAGLHVMIFSDNVRVEDELSLKDDAVRRGLLLMGPDCGTAIINGTMLGFANKVRRGPIGIVGASGTGTQEITCLIDRAGSGISQAIGTGGRDLSESVGARTTLFSIDALAADPDTRVIVVVSKPPSPAVAARVLERLASVNKPVVVQFVGAQRRETKGNVVHAPDLESAAWAAVDLASGADPASRNLPPYPAQELGSELVGKTAKQRAIRGLFTGGTMAAEALAVMTRAFGPVATNLSHGACAPTQVAPGEHLVLDLGGDEFTQGRPHPMIDPTPRFERLMKEADNDAMAVALLDIVLGTGSHADPAGAMIPAIEQAKARAISRGQTLSVVASVTGTAGDSQGLAAQIAKLVKAGVVVCPSNIQAVRLACAIVEAQHG
ncbi:MAG: hypothetical protein MUF54_21810, partial [Polyangiaceae bacterium]|nr:hypothetical protein [Polyangiaceae bacterium]